VKQQSLASQMVFEKYRPKSRREQFLDEMEQSRDAIVSHMESNLRRCGAHPRIVAAIESAGRRIGELS
jgi:aerobic-type carbon monoxide dehydrogenase small subunit (CoxS/CutS family)